MTTNILEQFYILSTRGDSIIFRDFRTDATKLKSTVDTFYTAVTAKHTQPVKNIFTLHHINYVWLRKNTLYFVFSTRYNVSPATATELLVRLTRILKDFCGQLNEDTIRINFVLIYELLDEIIDYGYIQTTTTDYLKNYVFNTPIVLPSANTSGATHTLSHTLEQVSSVTNNVVNNLVNNNLKGIVSSPSNTKQTTPSSSVHKPVIDSVTASSGAAEQRKNEIYVDIYERITAVFNSNAVCLHSSIDGTIQVKSYLYGKPALKLALNDNLCIRSQNVGDCADSRNVVLDDCLYHHSVDLSDFDAHRMLHFTALDGEYTLMNYRISGRDSNYALPFKLYPHVELIDVNRYELLLQLRSDISPQYYAGNIAVNVNVPKHATAVSAELRADSGKNQAYEYSANAHRFVWKIKKLKGDGEEQCRVKITLAQPLSVLQLRRAVNSIVVNFEIPMYAPSGLQVRYLRINEGVAVARELQPYRWVRYVCRSQSYVVRL